MPTISGGTVAPGPAPVFYEERTFTEEGAGTYTATVAIPGGGYILDIVVYATALWGAATSASLEVGDDNDADGFFTAVDLKATDLLADESANFDKQGGVGGAYITAGTSTHVTDRFSATARTITATVVSVGAGTAGRTRVAVLYTLPGGRAAASFVAT